MRDSSKPISQVSGGISTFSKVPSYSAGPIELEYPIIPGVKLNKVHRSVFKLDKLVRKLEGLCVKLIIPFQEKTAMKKAENDITAASGSRFNYSDENHR